MCRFWFKNIHLCRFWFKKYICVDIIFKNIQNQKKGKRNHKKNTSELVLTVLSHSWNRVSDSRFYYQTFRVLYTFCWLNKKHGFLPLRMVCGRLALNFSSLERVYKNFKSPDENRKICQILKCLLFEKVQIENVGREKR